MELSEMGFNEEQMAAINAHTQKSIDTEVTGLKSKNDDLILEKKTALEQKTESDRVAAEAEKLRLAQAGKWDELQAVHAQELATATATATQQAEVAQSRLDQLHKNSAITSVLNGVDDRFKGLARTQLESFVQVAYNEQGEPVTSFKNGSDVIASNTSDFLAWGATNDTWKAILKGVDSSGAGATKTGATLGGAEGGKIDGTKSERVQASIAANPKLKDLPLR